MALRLACEGWDLGKTQLEKSLLKIMGDSKLVRWNSQNFPPPGAQFFAADQVPDASEEEQSESLRLPGGALFLAVSTRTLYAHGPTASSLALVSLPASFYSMAVGDDIVLILW